MTCTCNPATSTYDYLLQRLLSNFYVAWCDKNEMGLLWTNENCHHSWGKKKLLSSFPDDMPAGQTPHTVMLFAHNTLVDAVQAGDRVTVTGIYRAIPIQVNPRMRNVRSAYRTHIDVVHFRKIDNKRLHDMEDG